LADLKRDHPNPSEKSETQKILPLGGLKWGMENAMFFNILHQWKDEKYSLQKAL
jgi:hypothetical protein